MRKALCDALVAAADHPDFVFMTGDLGFMALEPLRGAMGPRFINAGVAEQNMISVAAGLARGGIRAWAYSIAPFIYARPYEQIRNDLCLHDLPVVLVGNGGGYGYGVMGATHHALEDYGALLCLPNIRAFIPAFDADIAPVVTRLFDIAHPAYLRLGATEEPKDFKVPQYACWRKLLGGGGLTMIVVGPLAGGILAAVRGLKDSRRPNVWLLSELPVDRLPEQLMIELRASDHLLLVEEHVARGGAGEMIAWHLLRSGLAPRRFTHRYALGYVSKLYGSQKFHRQECGLDPASIAELCIAEAPE